jgi:hypothetical protein
MKVTLKYSFIFALIAMGITAAIVFLSKIFLIIGIAAASFIIGLIIDYAEAMSKRRRKK